MFCNQCQETLHNTGCDKVGVCGKKDDVSNLQDELVVYLANVCHYKPYDKKMMQEISGLLFSTITNVNFSASRFTDGFIKQAKNLLGNNQLLELPNDNEDIKSLKQLLLYGLKGHSAYECHARHLGFMNKAEDEVVYKVTHKALASLLKPNLTLQDMLGLVDEAGAAAVQAMAALDDAHVTTLGKQQPNTIKVGLHAGKGILITGHDMKDLLELLKQTEGKGVDIYTHGEMITAHAYPELRKFKHLKGHFGTAWQNQQKEFPGFNGPIVFTTNCIQKPLANYEDRVFTTHEVGYDNVKHIESKADGSIDYSVAIDYAIKNSKLEPSTNFYDVTVGYAKDTVLSVADKVIDAVKSGAITKFVVMGGCDGRHAERSYYTEFAKALPKSAVILASGCAKYRYNSLDLGDIGGIPRMLDAGQCNDSYSLAIVALKLKEAFGLKDVNELPLMFNIAWYEQKAVTVLLALLHLGFKNVRIGPTLPGFLSPNVTKFLADNLGLTTIKSVKEDLALV